MTARPASTRPLVWTLALLCTVSYGALYYAQPLLAVATEHATGWTRVQTGLAFTAALLVSAVLAPRVGRHLDQRGGRHLLSGGALCGAAAFVILALTRDYGVFLCAWLLAGLAMTLTFYEAAFTVLGQHVAGARRTRATLTVTLVAGLASTIFVPLTTLLLDTAGLRGALFGLAGLLLAVAGLAWWKVPDREVEPASQATGPFTPDRAAWQLAASLTLARIVTVGVGLQLAPLLLASGYRPGEAAALTGLLGLSALPGRVVFVPCLRWVGPVPLTITLMGLLAAGTGLLLSGSTALKVTGIVLFGLASGALTLARSELLVRGYPSGLYGAVNGWLARPVNLAQALTPVLMGGLYLWTGGYRVSLLLLSGVGAVAAWLVSGVNGRTEARQSQGARAIQK
ncbi:MFS transporter [Deinococcus radiotolerans]|uniref:MFS transporter n=1 Tax=Deinococcus radiotolerans TaxID=1309407 RepID=A0ABQ2FPK9_9DEIO|nr:MFS transporter [Deinococcus radiotolerans]GGL14220.1 MFS transporter [Deinococcus radiotolerans]